MSSRLRRHRRSPTSELQITAFMNLMVVLVPFLLITAVFSQLTVLELTLPEPPDPESEEAPLPPGLRLEIRGTAVVVRDGEREPERFERNPDGTLPVEAVAEHLAGIKAERPDEERITLLLEPDIAYDDLIAMMDAARLQPTSQDPMFPLVAIGDAPVPDDDTTGARP